MREQRDRQTAHFVRRYRFFLCLLLLTVLLAFGFYCRIRRQAEIPKEGTLVRQMCDERKQA